MHMVERKIEKTIICSTCTASVAPYSKENKASHNALMMGSKTRYFNLCKLALGISTAVLMSAGGNVHAADSNWNGSGIAGDFYDANNWASGSVPDSGDNLYFNVLPGAVLQDPIAAGSLNIGSAQGSEGQVTLSTDNQSWSGDLNGAIAIGVNGGTGTLDATNTESSTYYLHFTDGLNLGSGLGSTGTINALGNGKSSDFKDASLRLWLDDPSSEGGMLYAGADQGQGIINIEGGSLSTSGGLTTILGHGIGSMGSMNIIAGGKFVANTYSSQGQNLGLVIGDEGGTGSLNIGTGTGLDRNIASIYQGLSVGRGSGSNGTVNILGGGKLTSYDSSSEHLNSAINVAAVGVDQGTGKVTIDGAGSIWMVTGEGAVYSESSTIGNLNLGSNGKGVITLSNGGELFVGATKTEQVYDNDIGGIDRVKSGTQPVYDQRGSIYSASTQSSIGIINFGSDPDKNIGGAAAGKLFAEKIILGEGETWINFNFDETLKYSSLLPEYAVPPSTIPDRAAASPFFDNSVQGNGTLNIASYAGTTHLDTALAQLNGVADIYGGTLFADHSDALGTSVIRSRYHVAIPEGGTLGYANTINLTNDMQLQAGAHLSLRVDNSDSATQAGDISGSGNLNKVGTGTLNLSGTNTFTGNTHIAEGVLALRDDSSLARSAGVTANGVLDISELETDSAIRTLAGSGAVTLGSNALNITAGGGNGEGSGLFSGVISGAGGFNVSGGIQQLSGANTYQGTSTIGNGGALSAMAQNTLSPNASYTVDAGGALLLNGFDQRVNTLNNAGFVIFNTPWVENSVFRPTTLTVTGANTYIGSGGLVHLTTQLGGDNSLTDKLVINGNSTGTSYLQISNAGGAGAQTDKGIEVVQVGGTSTGTFALAGPVQTEAFEYRLIKGDAQNAANGNWYLSSESRIPGLCPDGSTGPCADPDAQPYYRPGVANVVAGQSANMEQGMTMLASLHQRIGGTYNLQDDELLAWSRLYNTDDRTEGDRFNYNQRITGMQLGHDLWVSHNGQGVTQRAGVSVDYTNANADLADQIRGRENLGRKHTGTMDTNAVSLGGYYTLSREDGSYLDTIAMVSHLRNGFEDIYNGTGTQKAWRAGVSAEVGKPVASVGQSWKLEPQAQLSYQYTRYNSFEDDVSKVDSYHVNSLRGRVGVRLFNDLTEQEKPGQVYVIANVLHDLIKPTKVSFGDTRVRDDYDSTAGELGVGGRMTLSKNTTVFGDARYRQSFGGDAKGTALNVGIQFDF